MLRLILAALLVCYVAAFPEAEAEGMDSRLNRLANSHS